MKQKINFFIAQSDFEAANLLSINPFQWGCLKSKDSLFFLVGKYHKKQGKKQDK